MDRSKLSNIPSETLTDVHTRILVRYIHIYGKITIMGGIGVGICQGVVDTSTSVLISTHICHG